MGTEATIETILASASADRQVGLSIAKSIGEAFDAANNAVKFQADIYNKMLSSAIDYRRTEIDEWYKSKNLQLEIRQQDIMRDHYKNMEEIQEARIDAYENEREKKEQYSTLLSGVTKMGVGLKAEQATLEDTLKYNNDRLGSYKAELYGYTIDENGVKKPTGFAPIPKGTDRFRDYSKYIAETELVNSQIKTKLSDIYRKQSTLSNVAALASSGGNIEDLQNMMSEITPQEKVEYFPEETTQQNYPKASEQRQRSANDLPLPEWKESTQEKPTISIKASDANKASKSIKLNEIGTNLGQTETLDEYYDINDALSQISIGAKPVIIEQVVSKLDKESKEKYNKFIKPDKANYMRGFALLNAARFTDQDVSSANKKVDELRDELKKKGVSNIEITLLEQSVSDAIRKEMSEKTFPTKPQERGQALFDIANKIFLKEISDDRIPSQTPVDKGIAKPRPSIDVNKYLASNVPAIDKLSDQNIRKSITESKKKYFSFEGDKKNENTDDRILKMRGFKKKFDEEFLLSDGSLSQKFYDYLEKASYLDLGLPDPSSYGEAAGVAVEDLIKEKQSKMQDIVSSVEKARMFYTTLETSRFYK